MKTIIATLVAGLAISVAIGNGNEAQAKGFRSFVNGTVNSLQQQGGFNRQANFAIKQVTRGHFGGVQTHCPPRPICPPQTICPPRPICPPPIVCPPQPPVCHVYLVYYYDCHFGWKFYGQYHDHYAASQAVNNLQRQGYRAYMKQAVR